MRDFDAIEGTPHVCGQRPEKKGMRIAKVVKIVAEQEEARRRFE